jgi:hypothetical protein
MPCFFSFTAARVTIPCGEFIPCTMNFSPKIKPLAFVKEEERPDMSEEDLLGQSIVNLFKP